MVAKQHQSKVDKSYADSPRVRELVNDLTFTVQNAGPDPVQKAFAAILGPPKHVARALYLPTLTADIWISACAPNGQIVWARSSPTSTPGITYRPTLYAYSTAEPALKPLGLVWLQTAAAYNNILRRSKGVEKELLQSKMNSGNTEAVGFVGDPAKLLFQRKDGGGTGLSLHSGDAPSRERPQSCGEAVSSSQVDSQPVPLSAAAARLKQNLLDVGRRDDFAWQPLCALPADESHRSAILGQRRVEKVRIAIISGPAEGTSQRYGVPFAYPLNRRRFFRALVLLDKVGTVRGRTALCSESMGTCEIELDAIEALEEAKFEDVLLV
jgi:hypothetical protein